MEQILFIITTVSTQQFRMFVAPITMFYKLVTKEIIYLLDKQTPIKIVFLSSYLMIVEKQQ